MRRWTVSCVTIALMATIGCQQDWEPKDSSSFTELTAVEYPKAEFEPADPTNYTEADRPNDDAILQVIFAMSQGTYSGTIAYFQTPSVGGSAHYILAEDGRVAQMVSEADRAWFVGGANTNTVGVSLEGDSTDPSHPEPLYQAAAELGTYLAWKYDIPEDRSGFIGRDEIKTSESNPGDGWDWNHFITLLQATEPWGDLVGFVRACDIQDPDAGLANARVYIETAAGAAVTDVIARTDGLFSVPELPLGDYVIKVQEPGFYAAQRDVQLVSENAYSQTWGSIAVVPLAGCGDEL